MGVPYNLFCVHILKITTYPDLKNSWKRCGFLYVSRIHQQSGRSFQGSGIGFLLFSAIYF